MRINFLLFILYKGLIHTFLITTTINTIIYYYIYKPSFKYKIKSYPQIKVIKEKLKMKLECNKEDLIEIINTVQKAIASKSAMPILECIKIETSNDGNVIFTGTNVDLYIEYNKKIKVEEGGSVCLLSKIFGEIVRRLPQGNVKINVNSQNNVTKIKCGSSEFNIQGLNSNDFPNVPILDEKFRFSLTYTQLRNLIKKTISFTALNEGRKPVLTGSLYEIRENLLNVVSSDGHRLALVRQALDTNIENNKFVVPGNTQRELLKILTEDDEKYVDIIVSDRYVLFDFKDFQVYSRILDGDFIKYDSILATVNNINVTVDRNIIMNSLERALLLINEDISAKSDNKVPVRLSINSDKIDLACITGKGQVNDIIPAKVEGENLLIGFNCRFLMDAFNACDEEKIKLELSAPTSGCFIRDNSGNEEYIYMILPVRLYN